METEGFRTIYHTLWREGLLRVGAYKAKGAYIHKDRT